MSDDQTYYYGPTTGPPFLILTPYNQVSPPRPPPSSPVAPASLATEWVEPPTPEPAPLGSFENPYPANCIPLPSLPPSTNTSTTSTHYTPALAPLYGSLAHTNISTAEIPVQVFGSTPLPCRCNAVSGDQRRGIAPKHDYGGISSGWWLAPLTSPLSAEARQQQQQQQQMMWCTHCGQAVEFHPAPPPPAPTTINPTISSTQPQPPPTPSAPQSTNSNRTNPPTSSPPEPPASAAPPPQPATAVLGPQDQMLDSDFAFQYEIRKWPHCHVCNEKPALREKEGLLFCRGCWSEAESAQRERERRW